MQTLILSLEDARDLLPGAPLRIPHYTVSPSSMLSEIAIASGEERGSRTEGAGVLFLPEAERLRTATVRALAFDLAHRVESIRPRPRAVVLEPLDLSPAKTSPVLDERGLMAATLARRWAAVLEALDPGPQPAPGDLQIAPATGFWTEYSSFTGEKYWTKAPRPHLATTGRKLYGTPLFAGESQLDTLGRYHAGHPVVGVRTLSGEEVRSE